jgi:hypothetical protein
MTQNHPKNRITVGSCRSPQAAIDASITVIHGDSQTPPGAVMIVTIGRSGLNMLCVLEKACICGPDSKSQQPSSATQNRSFLRC